MAACDRFDAMLSQAQRRRPLRALRPVREVKDQSNYLIGAERTHPSLLVKI
jgi:hypothetical protein